MIMGLNTKELRNEYLRDKVPEHLHDLVRQHVMIAFERKRWTRNQNDS